MQNIFRKRFTVWKKGDQARLKNVINKMWVEIIYLIYMYKKDLSLHKTNPKQKSNISSFLTVKYKQMN